MADETKTPADMMSALAKALGQKIDELKSLEKKEYNAAEVFQTLQKAAVERITKLEVELKKMQELEASGAQTLEKKLKKDIGSVPDSTPSSAELADPSLRKEDFVDNAKRGTGSGEKRWKSFDAVGAKAPASASEIKVVEAKGSGGGIEKAKKLIKDAMAMQKMPKMPKPPALKPAGVPGAKAGDAPKAPSAPQAPGAAPAMKGEKCMAKDTGMDLAMGELPDTSPEHQGGPMPTEKGELPDTSPEHQGGPMPTEKMELPTTSKKANGGKISKEELRETFNKTIMPAYLQHVAAKAANPTNYLPHAPAGQSHPALLAHPAGGSIQPTLQAHSAGGGIHPALLAHPAGGGIHPTLLGKEGMPDNYTAAAPSGSNKAPHLERAPEGSNKAPHLDIEPEGKIKPVHLDKGAVPEGNNGGEIEPEVTKKAAMDLCKSPVFRAGTPKMDNAKMMSMHANADAHKAAGMHPSPVFSAGKVAKMPTPEEHAARAAQFADFMPK